MSRLVYLVTHGQKEQGPNPGLTALGRKQVQQLRAHLPGCIHSVLCGVGRRHLDTAKELGLDPDRYTSIIGAAESKNRATDTIILADGTEIPDDKYSTPSDRAEVFARIVRDQPSRTVIIISRPMIKILQKNSGHPKEATVYTYNPDTGELKEVFAASEDIGAGAREV